MFIYIYMILHENKKERKKLKICNKQKKCTFSKQKFNQRLKNSNNGKKWQTKNDQRRLQILDKPYTLIKKTVKLFSQIAMETINWSLVETWWMYRPLYIKHFLFNNKKNIKLFDLKKTVIFSKTWFGIFD